MGMTPRQWFALVLRYLGATTMLSGVSYVLQAYDVYKGLYNSGVVTTLGSVNHAVCDGLVGLGLLFFADHIAAFFMPPRRPAPPPEAEQREL